MATSREFSDGRALAKLEPLNRLLSFCCHNDSDDPMVVISIASDCRLPIAYKVKSTSPNFYEVHPHRGILQPCDTANVTIKFIHGDRERISADQFGVVVKRLDKNVRGLRLDNPELWREPESKSIMNYINEKFRCCLVKLCEDDAPYPRVEPPQEAGYQRNSAPARNPTMTFESFPRMPCPSTTGSIGSFSPSLNASFLQTTAPTISPIDLMTDQMRKCVVRGDVIYGCGHYQRKCSFVSPCCDKVYICRLCHDEGETHEIDRHAVMNIVCQVCDTRQSVSNNCINCGVQFGRYFCSICRMYDDRDRQQFHCEHCGICRIGGRENYVHCPKCNICLSTALKNSHTCVENVSESECPVCLDSLHSSLVEMHVPKCGHIMHDECWKNMLKSGNYACPICCQSTTDLTAYWRRLDEEIASTPMPEEYRDTKVWILCRDCQAKCNTVFHVVGLKCVVCGSYNTCRDAEQTNNST